MISVATDASLQLASAGKACLADIQLPDKVRAQQWLASHVLQQAIRYRAIGEDRYGCTLIVSDVQEALLRDGVAVLYAQGKPRKSWLTAEAEARAAKRAVWASAALVTTPEKAMRDLQQFKLVDGTITHIYRGRKATYLNFGKYWRSDFSVMIDGRSRRSFEKLLATLAPGSKVRVRGTIYSEDGPMIRLSRPEQLEAI